jgi:hypothetical protein
VGFRPSYGSLVLGGDFSFEPELVAELETILYVVWEHFDVL